MNTEMAAAHIKALLCAPKMSDYLTKALQAGMQQNVLSVNRSTVETCKMCFDVGQGLKHFSTMKLGFTMGNVPRYVDLVILNVDELGDLKGADRIFNLAYGALTNEYPNRPKMPEARDYWVSNYVPGKDVVEEVQQVYLGDYRPDETTYLMATKLLELAGLPLERLHLVHLDDLGLRHVISMPNENDDDPEMTYVLLDLAFGANNNRTADYRLRQIRDMPPMLHQLLSDLMNHTAEDASEPHPLDTDEEKVEWGYFGPYHVVYRQNTMFIYTGEDENMLPAEALIEVESAAFGSFHAGYVWHHSGQVLSALETLPALYVESAGSIMARDLLAVNKGKGDDMRTISAEVRVNDAKEPVWLRLRQGEAIINFNLQY